MWTSLQTGELACKPPVYKLQYHNYSLICQYVSHDSVSDFTHCSEYDASVVARSFTVVGVSELSCEGHWSKHEPLNDRMSSLCQQW